MPHPLIIHHYGDYSPLVIKEHNSLLTTISDFGVYPDAVKNNDHRLSPKPCPH